MFKDNSTGVKFTVKNTIPETPACVEKSKSKTNSGQNSKEESFKELPIVRSYTTLGMGVGIGPNLLNQITPVDQSSTKFNLIKRTKSLMSPTK